MATSGEMVITIEEDSKERLELFSKTLASLTEQLDLVCKTLDETARIIQEFSEAYKKYNDDIGGQ